jgi:hypothetical protein
MTQPALPAVRNQEPTQLTKDDLAVVTSVYKAQVTKFDRWGVAGVLGGLTLGMLLIFAGSEFGWGEKWAPVFFFGGWGIAFLTMVINWRRNREALAGLQVWCSHCSAPLIEIPRFLRLSRPAKTIARAELILATGTCPGCGHEFLFSEA